MKDRNRVIFDCNSKECVIGKFFLPIWASRRLVVLIQSQEMSVGSCTIYEMNLHAKLAALIIATAMVFLLVVVKLQRSRERSS